MSDDVKALLRRYDDAEHVECPAGFDTDRARKRAEGLAAGLRKRLGQEAVGALDVRIEDASFHSELSFPGGYGLLRFSSFGDLIALTPDHELAASIVSAVNELAPAHGYTLVPTNALETDYAGRVPGIRNWWIRYFDYL